MPANVVKTAGDARHWKMAKDAAATQGRPKDYAYIMGIYSKMSKAQEPGDDEDPEEGAAPPISMKLPPPPAPAAPKPPPPSAIKSEAIPGGLASGKKPSDFPKDKLKAGIKVEMEHATDWRIAQEIAMDHLTEDPDYYAKLATIEKGGGEGSRGGTVIGHTSKGKPIYHSPEAHAAAVGLQTAHEASQEARAMRGRYTGLAAAKAKAKEHGITSVKHAGEVASAHYSHEHAQKQAAAGGGWQKTAGGYQIKGKLGSAEVVKEGKRFVLKYNGETHEMPRRGASFDHAEGKMAEIDRDAGAAKPPAAKPLDPQVAWHLDKFGPGNPSQRGLSPDRRDAAAKPPHFWSADQKQQFEAAKEAHPHWGYWKSLSKADSDQHKQDQHDHMAAAMRHAAAYQSAQDQEAVGDHDENAQEAADLSAIAVGQAPAPEEPEPYSDEDADADEEQLQALAGDDEDEGAPQDAMGLDVDQVAGEDEDADAEDGEQATEALEAVQEFVGAALQAVKKGTPMFENLARNVLDGETPLIKAMGRLSGHEQTQFLRTLRELRKGGGEGSRGGTIVGHTTSGKPIYKQAGGDHPSYTHSKTGEKLKAIHTTTEKGHEDKAPSMVRHEGKNYVKAGHNSDSGSVSYHEHDPGKHLIDPDKGTAIHATQLSTRDSIAAGVGGKMGNLFHAQGTPEDSSGGGNLPREINDPVHGRMRVRGYNSDKGTTTYHNADKNPGWKSLPEGDLAKGGGEGSRGGKIIGHSASGRPIYHKEGGNPGQPGKATYQVEQAANQRNPGKPGAYHGRDHVAEPHRFHDKPDHGWGAIGDADYHDHMSAHHQIQAHMADKAGGADLKKIADQHRAAADKHAKAHAAVEDFRKTPVSAGLRDTKRASWKAATSAARAASTETDSTDRGFSRSMGGDDDMRKTLDSTMDDLVKAAGGFPPKKGKVPPKGGFAPKAGEAEEDDDEKDASMDPKGSKPTLMKNKGKVDGVAEAQQGPDAGTAGKPPAKTMGKKKPMAPQPMPAEGQDEGGDEGPGSSSHHAQQALAHLAAATAHGKAHQSAKAAEGADGHKQLVAQANQATTEAAGPVLEQQAAEQQQQQQKPGFPPQKQPPQMVRKGMMGIDLSAEDELLKALEDGMELGGQAAGLYDQAGRSRLNTLRKGGVAGGTIYQGEHIAPRGSDDRESFMRTRELAGVQHDDPAGNRGNGGLEEWFADSYGGEPEVRVPLGMSLVSKSEPQTRIVDDHGAGGIPRNVHPQDGQSGHRLLNQGGGRENKR